MIRLRNMEGGDLPLFEEWLRAPHVAPWFRDAADWVAEVRGRDGEFGWIHHFIAEEDGVPVGFCQYYAIADSGETYAGQELRGAYSIDYLVGDAARLRRGVGKQIVAALTRRVLLHRDARRIVLQPEPGNAASCGLLLSCGFVREETGVFVKELRQGPAL